MLEEKIYTADEWKNKILPLVRSNQIVRTGECVSGLQCGLCNGYVSRVKTVFHKFYKCNGKEYGIHAFRNLQNPNHTLYIRSYEKQLKLKTGTWTAEDWNNLILPAIQKGLIKQIKTLPRGLMSLYNGILEEQEQRFEVNALIDNNHVPYVKVSNEQYN